MTAVDVLKSPRDSCSYVHVTTPRANAELRNHASDSVDPAVTKLIKTSVASEATSESAAPPVAPPAPPAKSSVSLLDLYRYATATDKLLVVIGCVCAAINGVLYPCMALVFGDAIGAFDPFDQTRVNRAAPHFFLIAVTLLVTDCGAYVCFAASAERQAKVLRERALHRMLHLGIAWYDANDAMQLTSRLTADTVKIKDGMGQKLGDTIKYGAQFLTGYIIAFSKSWDLSLVMLCVVPVMVGTMSILMNFLRTRAVRSAKLYAEAGAVAEETLASMRTVASLNAEKLAIQRFNEKTTRVADENIAFFRKASVLQGTYTASLWIMYAIGLWYGGHKVYHSHVSPSVVFQAFYGVIMGSSSMGYVSPNLVAVAEARGVAAGIFQILDTPSTIDASDDSGLTPNKCLGRIEAIDVHFAYPSRPDAPILSGYNVTVEAGQTVAFVGASGGGKSTLISLLERFYDPTSGSILLDGRDVKTLNVKWLRSQIGLVSQEPVLFATSIFDNIAAGLTASGRLVTREQVEAAAKLANAHNFIVALPQGYDTLVGEKGVSLSGGQKQRVAIARAIVREPKILVLDEATSALDNESERVVQEALNDLMDKTKMTTLVIAHRLSTVRRADKIVVLSDGKVVEEGSHDELLSRQDGVYRGLYTIQEETARKEAEELAQKHDDDDDDLAGPWSTGLHGRASATSRASMTGYEVEDNQTSVATPFTVKEVNTLCRPERGHFVLGLFAAAVHGVSLPISALLLSEAIAVMTSAYKSYTVDNDRSALNHLMHDVRTTSIGYIAGAVCVCIVNALQVYTFRYMAEKIVARLRDIHFTAFCRQNIGFFDETKNATGALTTDLAVNATKVSMMSGDSQGRLVQAGATFAVALLVSFTSGSWLLTLIMLAVFPFLLIGQVIWNKNVRTAGGMTDELAHSGAHASQALCNIRTVASLGLEKDMCAKFSVLLDEPLRGGVKTAKKTGVAIGFSSFIMFATYALVFWYGGVLVNKDDITFKQLIRTLMAIMMSAQGMGFAISWVAESTQASKAGSAIFTLRDRALPIDSFDASGDKPSTVQGHIEFRNVAFRYPTRPDVSVLKNYNLSIEPGQTVAFCGPSGGGKSTIISLIERFYDPVKGDVLLDGVNLKDLNLQWLRSQIGLVGQEPTLFIGTIADNIAYGLKEKPSQAEIEEAAKMANAHDFITKFPDGYDTQVGMKGEQLSGGQKQRIAIARAILKNPNVLLLDEATSALDSESEKVVQEALDKVVALKKRTTIIIAHRLSTIRKADKICVVSGGKIAEQGTHQELLQLNGIYAELVQSATH